VLVLSEDLRTRRQTARFKAKAFGLSAHIEITGFIEEFLDGFLLEDFTEAPKSKLSVDVLALENYVKAAGEGTAEGGDDVPMLLSIDQSLNPYFKLLSDRCNLLFSKFHLDGAATFLFYGHDQCASLGKPYRRKLMRTKLKSSWRTSWRDGCLIWDDAARKISRA
jgi:hypothetical protein